MKKIKLDELNSVKKKFTLSNPEFKIKSYIGYHELDKYYLFKVKKNNTSNEFILKVLKTNKNSTIKTFILKQNKILENSLSRKNKQYN